MTALQSLLPASTPIQQAVIESALDTVAGNWPGIIISCPVTKEDRPTTAKKQEIHTVHVQFLDQWDSTTRTVQQMYADTRAALEQMKANVRANRTLTVNGSPNALLAGDTIETEVQGAITDKELPWPMFAASLVFEIWDLWFTG